MADNELERELTTLRRRVRQLEKALFQDDPHLEILFGLSPSLANLFGLLLSKEFVSRQVAQYEMKVVADAQVAIWRLRERLDPRGIKIRTRRGIGWYLDDETKRRIHQLIGAHHGKIEEGQAKARSKVSAEGGRQENQESSGSEHRRQQPARRQPGKGGKPERQAAEDQPHRRGDGREAARAWLRQAGGDDASAGDDDPDQHA
jgi:hypothetical protein